MARARAELPLATTIVVVAAAVVFFSPGGFALAVFDRDAFAAGEWWRLLTGSLAHYSGRHLAGDLAVVAVGGWLVERREPRAAAVLLGGSMLASTLGVLIASPTLRLYAGLSGAGHALAVWIALDAAAVTAGQVRRLSVVALVAIAAKVGWGLFSPHLLSGSPGIAVAETSHAAAAIFAAVWYAGHSARAQRVLEPAPAAG